MDFLRQADWLTSERVRRIGLVFAALFLVLLAGDVWLHTRNGLTDASGEQLGRDFVNYWSGARLAAEGRAAFAYDIEGFLAYQRSLTGPEAEFKWYAYPPPALLLTLPLAALPFSAALALWLVAGAGVCAVLMSRITGWTWAPVLAAVAAPAAAWNAMSGQNGQYSAALLAGGLILLRTRPVAAGILFGLLCFKPHLGLLIPVALAAGGCWRAFAAAAATVAGLFAGSVLAFGWEPWAAFIENAPLHRALMETHAAMWPRMPSVFAAGRLAGLETGAAYLAQGISSLLALLAVAAVWRSGASASLKNAALIAGAFLATPYAWDYDLVALLFVVAWVAAEAARTGFRPWEKITLAGLVVMPLFAAVLALRTHVHVEPFLLWAVLGLILRRALEAPARRPVSLQPA